jgi:hypothetical protein
MNARTTRREFLSSVGQGMLVASVGASLATDLGLSPAFADEGGERLSFGPLEPLVAMMQETPINRLLPTLVEKLKTGTQLETLLAAGALANARTFGGEDYIGFHTMMALAPAMYMAREMPEDRRALPVFKVLYRNTNRIHEHGGRDSEVLKPVQAAPLSPGQSAGEALQAAARAKDIDRAERTFASSAKGSPSDAFNDLLYMVEDGTDVHRVVLPYRAYDLLGLIGPEQAHTLLRQSVRYCVKQEDNTQSSRRNEPRALLPKLLDEHKLLGRAPGDRAADDAWIDQLSQTIFSSSPEQAAGAVAAALAEGFAPDDIGAALSLTANQLVLRDRGRTPQQEWPGKPIGSVHGDSIGVHSCDSTNAWRNMARVGNPRNMFACLILGAYQIALDRSAPGADFANWNPVPVAYHLNEIKSAEPDALLVELDETIRSNLQARASALTHRYVELGHAPRKLFDLFLRYATSEDGALHAEKYYRTVCEEYAATRPAFRPRQLVALARVTASEYGRPAPGYAEAKSLLSVT